MPNDADAPSDKPAPAGETSAAEQSSTPALSAQAHRLLASISHAIRTPLSGIVGAASLLAEGDVSDEGMRHLKLLKRSANSLLYLMSDVLDLFRIESGELRPRLSQTTPKLVVDDLVSTLSEFCERTNTKLVVEDAGLDAQAIRTDGKRVARAIAALARALIRRFDPAHLRIRPRIVDCPEIGPCLDCDLLMPLPADQAEGFGGLDVFQESAAPQESGDDSLEVWVSVKLIRLMGGLGREFYDQKAGAWCLRLAVPVEYSESSRAEAVQERLEGSVLLVMPPSEQRRSVEEVVRTLELELLIAESGQDALRMLLTDTPAEPRKRLLLIGDALADVTGSELVQLVRRLPMLRRVGIGAIGKGVDEPALFHLPTPVRQQHLQEALTAAFADKAPFDAKREASSKGSNPRQTRVIANDGAASGAKDSASSTRVLIVEDHPVNCMIVSAMLKRLGCEVDEVTNGEDAVQRAASGEFDLIFMDYELPKLNGIEATRRIRESMGAGSQVPIIALSGHAFDSDRQAFLDAGMNDHLAKPVTPEALSGILDLWTDNRTTVRVPLNASRNKEEAKPRRARQRAERQEQADQSGSDKPTTVVDMDFLSAFERTTSRDVVSSSLTSFISYAQEDMQGLIEAIARKDSASIMRGAQRLGGAADSIGARELRETCKLLESAARSEQQALFSEALAKIKEGLASLEGGLRDAGYLGDAARKKS